MNLVIFFTFTKVKIFCIEISTTTKKERYKRKHPFRNVKLNILSRYKTCSFNFISFQRGLNNTVTYNKTLVKFHLSFNEKDTVILSNFRRTRTVPKPDRTKLKLFIKNSLGTFNVPYYRTIIKNFDIF